MYKAFKFRLYPSSQECNMCGKIDKKYKGINERTYICTKCHHKQSSDLNASINIYLCYIYMNKEC